MIVNWKVGDRVAMTGVGHGTVAAIEIGENSGRRILYVDLDLADARDHQLDHGSRVAVGSEDVRVEPGPPVTHAHDCAKWNGQRSKNSLHCDNPCTCGLPLSQNGERDHGSNLSRRAKESGAEEQFVTPDGYTQLPERMREEIGLKDGGYVWFLKGKEVWEAWPEQKLEELLAEKPYPSPEERRFLEAFPTCEYIRAGSTKNEWPPGHAAKAVHELERKHSEAVRSAYLLGLQKCEEQIAKWHEKKAEEARGARFYDGSARDAVVEHKRAAKAIRKGEHRS